MTRSEYELTKEFVYLIIEGIDLLMSSRLFQGSWNKSKTAFLDRLEKFGKLEVPKK